MEFKRWLIESDWDEYLVKYGCDGWTDADNWGKCGASGMIVIAKDTGNILLDKRSAAVDGGAAWGTFGGAIDKVDKDAGESAKDELKQETGYSGPIQLVPAYRYEDPNDVLSNGKPWFYQNYIGIVPQQFNTQATASAQWETEGGQWFDPEEVLSMNVPDLPMHMGLKALIAHSGDKIRTICDKFINR